MRVADGACAAQASVVRTFSLSPRATDMRKAVNAALGTKYESKQWKKWFVETAKRVSEQLDADSANGNVHACQAVAFVVDFCACDMSCVVVSLFAFARCVFTVASMLRS